MCAPWWWAPRNYNSKWLNFDSSGKPGLALEIEGLEFKFLNHKYMAKVSTVLGILNAYTVDEIMFAHWIRDTSF